MSNILEMLQSSGGRAEMRTSAGAKPWGEVLSMASRAAGWIASNGRVVAVVASNDHESAAVIVGGLLSGGSVISLQTPHRGQSIEQYMQYLAATMQACGAEFLIVEPEMVSILDGSLIRVVSSLDVCNFAGRACSDGGGSLIQYSSGATGSPKGIQLSCDHIGANVLSTGDGIADGPWSSWLPMSHDFGLIGTLLLSWSKGEHLLLRTPQEFARDPLLWLRDIHDHQSVNTTVPSFALDMAVRRLDIDTTFNASLGSLQMIAIGGEMVRPGTLRRFQERLSAHGLGDGVLCPGYGMAEATLAVCHTKFGTPWKSVYVNSESMYSGILEPCGGLEYGKDRGETPTGSVELVSNGEAMHGFSVAPNAHGVLQIDGPSMFSGYTGEAPHTGVFDSKDVGVVVEDEVCIAGRADEVVVVRGRNLYPHDLEQLCESFVRAGNAAAVADGNGGLALVIESDSLDHKSVATQVRKVVSQGTGVSSSVVAVVERGSLLKTPSGKLKRREIGLRLADGQLPVLFALRSRE